MGFAAQTPLMPPMAPTDPSAVSQQGHRRLSTAQPRSRLRPGPARARISPGMEPEGPGRGGGRSSLRPPGPCGVCRGRRVPSGAGRRGPVLAAHGRARLPGAAGDAAPPGGTAGCGVPGAPCPGTGGQAGGGLRGAAATSPPAGSGSGRSPRARERRGRGWGRPGVSGVPGAGGGGSARTWPGRAIGSRPAPPLPPRAHWSAPSPSRAPIGPGALYKQRPAPAGGPARRPDWRGRGRGGGTNPGRPLPPSRARCLIRGSGRGAPIHARRGGAAPPPGSAHAGGARAPVAGLGPTVQHGRARETR